MTSGLFRVIGRCKNGFSSANSDEINDTENPVAAKARKKKTFFETEMKKQVLQ